MKHAKRLSTVIIAGAASLPLATWSADYARTYGDDFVIDAPVTYVEPLVRIVEVSTPKEVCWDQPVYERTRSYRSNTPVIVGGAIGGLVGAALGDGRRSRRGLAAVGALLGAGAGYQHSVRNAQPASTYVTQQRVCEIQQVTHQEERIDGYRVTYEYRGRSFVTQTATDPGSTIRVRVNVQPLAYNDGSSTGPYTSRSSYRGQRYES